MIDRYYSLRAEIQSLQEETKDIAKRIADDPRISIVTSPEASKLSEWSKFLANPRSVSSQEEITLSQLESALQAKWKSDTHTEENVDNS